MNERGATKGALWLKWPEAFDDLISIADPWRQIDPEGTKREAEGVLRKYSDGFTTRDELQEFLDCFADLPKDDCRSRYIPRSTRERVLAAGECANCGSGESLEVDHIKPFSRGGSHHISNLQCLCRPCNASKRDRTLEEWVAT